MTDPKASARKKIVERINIFHTKRGDLTFPRHLLEDGDGPKEVWTLARTTRTGLLPKSTHFITCLSEEEANALAEKFPVGSEFPEVPIYHSLCEQNPQFIREAIDDALDCSTPSFWFGARGGDDDSPLAFDTLEKAGLKTGLQLSQEVVDCLGSERITALKDRVGENWRVVATFEYCLLTVPEHSPAYVAAHYQFHHYITRDDFSAGYLWRDLEILVLGVEAQAMKSVEMRRKAGAMGSKASAAARETRRTELLEAMEDVARRNPDVTRLGESVLAELALSQCIEAEPSLWRQGKGQVVEYLGEIRRGEAGKEMQARYTALLGKKPPKRLG